VLNESLLQELSDILSNHRLLLSRLAIGSLLDGRGVGEVNGVKYTWSGSRGLARGGSEGVTEGPKNFLYIVALLLGELGVDIELERWKIGIGGGRG
jgi:hypothetical protein